MEVALVGAFSIIVIIGAIYIMKGTVMDITRPRENPWPLFWYIQLLLVLIPVVVISIVGIEQIQASGTRVLNGAVPNAESTIAGIVLGTITIYVLSLSVFLRLLRLRNLRDEIVFIKKQRSKIIYYGWGLTTLAIALFAMFYIVGFRHAFITSLLGSESLLRVRLHNAYDVGIPVQIIPSLFWVGYLLSIFSGFTFRLKSKIRSVLFFTVAVFIVSAPGNKAPVVISILLWFMAARIKMPRALLSPRSIFIAGATLLLFGILIYGLFKWQYPNADIAAYPKYVLNRIGVGQMGGTYVTFGYAYSGNFPEGEYYWALIPGASLINPEYINYQKALMMISEGYEFNKIGVKNTYFISEAYAIGGWWLVWLSPVIVAFSTAIGLKLYMILFRSFFFAAVAPQLALILYLSTHDITGGFAAFPLLKGAIVQGTILLILISPIKVCEMCLYIKNNRKAAFK